MGGVINLLRICKLFVLKILNPTKERHEKSHTKKFSDPDGQESLFHVCSSALIVNLSVFVRHLLLGAITHIRLENTKKILIQKEIGQKNIQ